MAIQTKVALKSVFETDDIPTQDNFADLIDSFVGSVNGVQPDTQGNVAITIPPATTVVNNLNSTVTTSALSAAQGKVINDKVVAHESKIATFDVLGHVKGGSNVFINADGVISVADGTTTAKGVVQLSNTLGTAQNMAATPNLVNTAITATNGNVTALTTRVATLEGQVADLLTRVAALEATPTP